MPLDASGSPRAHRPPPCSQGLAGRALEIGCFVRPPRLLGRWRLGQPCQSQDAAWWKGCGCTCEAGLPVARPSEEEAEVEKEKKGLAPHGPMGLCRFLLRQPWCEDTACCPHWVSLAHHRGGSQWTAHRTPGKGSPWSGSSVLGTRASDGVGGLSGNECVFLSAATRAHMSAPFRVPREEAEACGSHRHLRRSAAEHCAGDGLRAKLAAVCAPAAASPRTLTCHRSGAPWAAGWQRHAGLRPVSALPGSVHVAPFS